MDGANGGTTFTDNSQTPKTVTTIGSAATSTAQSKFGGASGLFSGASSGLSVADSAEFGAGSDFTIEGWIRPNSVTGVKAIVSKRTAGTIEYQLLLSGDKLYLDAQSGGGVLSLTGITSLALGSWYHMAATKSGNMWRLFLNGALQASGTALATYSASGAGVTIGWSAAVPAWGYAGYIDDLRITKGVARYTADFTPPTEAFPNASEVYALSGTVTGSTGSPVARAIRAIREDTGAYVGSVTSNATTGAYTIPTEYPGEHTVVVYPVTGENLPALVHHGVIPI